MNILSINLKGGAAKTTNASLVASYLPNATLIEIDKINQSDKRINAKDYESIQLDFLNESDNTFIDFEMKLLEDDQVNIIDVGAVKLEVFHKAMMSSSLYNTIDLIIIPAMDGSDDAEVAFNYLNTIKKEIDLSKKVMFSFNRFNEHEYTSPQEQFSSFFNKKKNILEEFKIDLDNEDNYYIIKDSRAIKIARNQKVTLKSLIDQDVVELTKNQRTTKDKKERLELTKKRSLVNSAQNLYNEYISVMMQKIMKKIS